MNDESRKQLTKFLGERWHELSGKIDETGMPYCSCGFEVHITSSELTHHIEKYYHTFTTPDDMDALRRKLVEKEDNYKFEIYAAEKYYDDLSGDDLSLAFWLMDPERFCSLVAEWLEETSTRQEHKPQSHGENMPENSPKMINNINSL